MRKLALLTASLTLGIAGVALAATTFRFSGKTSQKLGITLVLHGQMLDMHYAAMYSCTGGGRPSRPQPTDVVDAVLHHGSWSGSETVGHNDVVHTSGKIVGRTATGNFSETYTSRGGHICRSGKVSFTARR